MTAVSSLVGLLFDAWADLDRVLDSLDEAGVGDYPGPPARSL